MELGHRGFGPGSAQIRSVRVGSAFGAADSKHEKMQKLPGVCFLTAKSEIKQNEIKYENTKRFYPFYKKDVENIIGF